MKCLLILGTIEGGIEHLMLTNNTTNGDNQAENLAIIYVGNALSLAHRNKN